MSAKFKAPRGTFDIVYPTSERLERILQIGYEILILHGYRRISTPIFENTEVFRRGIGEDTDIVTKEMYTFEDRGGESLTLRPEGTAPVIRAYLERSLYSSGVPQKLFYFGPMFRRERPQAGRYRQFHQLGAEAIGSDDPAIDSEIISIPDIYFKKLGLKGYRLIVNSIGCVNCRKPYLENLRKFLRDAAEELCDDCRTRSKKNPLRVFDCKEEACARALSDAPLMRDYLCDECRAHFDSVLDMLDVLGVKHDNEPTLVRGLDYYTRTAFEFTFKGLGAQNAVCGGGRYDYLAEALGGPPSSGVGFSIGIERLLRAIELESIKPVDLPRLDVFVAAVEGTEKKAVLETLNSLRSAHLSADADFMGRSLKAQMKHANRLGARFAVIVGGEEFERGEMVLRDLDSSRQWTVRCSDLIQRIQGLIEAQSGDNNG